MQNWYAESHNWQHKYCIVHLIVQLVALTKPTAKHN